MAKKKTISKKTNKKDTKPRKPAPKQPVLSTSEMEKRITKRAKANTPKSDYFRIQATMPSEMSDYLDRLGSKCKVQHGFKLSKCEIIRSFISALQEVHSDLDLVEVKSEEELTKRIVEAFKKLGKKK